MLIKNKLIEKRTSFVRFEQNNKKQMKRSHKNYSAQTSKVSGWFICLVDRILFKILWFLWFKIQISKNKCLTS